MDRQKKCSVPNCETVQNSGIPLHSFPRTAYRQSVWLRLINCDSLNKLKSRQLMNKSVCGKHFERKFYENDRLLYIISRPTLFTAEEIKSGIPYSHNEKGSLLYNVKNVPIFLRDHLYFIPEEQNIGVQNQESSNTEKSAVAGHESCIDVDDNVAGDDDIGVNENLGGATNTEEVTKAAPFSWNNKSSEIVAETDMTVPSQDVIPIGEIDDTAVIQQGKEKTDMETASEKEADRSDRHHYGFTCNICEKDIVGFRYSCVQCPDFDLCAACESREAHAAHYMLRVPGPRPYSETQSVLGAVRRQLLRTDILLQPAPAMAPGLLAQDSIKEEKTEDVEEQDPFVGLASGAGTQCGGGPAAAQEDVSELLDEINVQTLQPQNVIKLGVLYRKRKRQDNDTKEDTEQHIKRDPLVVISRLPTQIISQCKQTESKREDRVLVSPRDRVSELLKEKRETTLDVRLRGLHAEGAKDMH